MIVRRVFGTKTELRAVHCVNLEGKLKWMGGRKKKGKLKWMGGRKDEGTYHDGVRFLQ
jgi:hypothetical protein